MQSLDMCPNTRNNFAHVFVWSMDEQKYLCMGCGKERTTYHELEDWEAKK